MADEIYKPGDERSGWIMGDDMVWRRPIPDTEQAYELFGGMHPDDLLGIDTKEEGQIKRGDWWPLAAVLTVVVLVVIGLWLMWDQHPDDSTPTPVVTVTTSPSPTFTKSPNGYATAYNIIEGVWQQERTNHEQQLICRAWVILPHPDVLDQLETGLKGANEKIGITDHQYREAATDFLNRECS